MAVQVEMGLAQNPLVLQSLSGPKKSTKPFMKSIPTKNPAGGIFLSAPKSMKTEASSFLSFPSAPDIFVRIYHSLVIK